MSSLSIKRFILTIGFSTLIAGCATSTMSLTERTEAYNQYIESEKLEKLDKIAAFKFDGWSSLGNEHLIISTSFNKPYLITLRQKCWDLRYTSTIAVHNNGNSLLTKFDSISVPQSNGLKCFIKSIHKISTDQKKALWKIGRKDKTKLEEKEVQDMQEAK